MGAAAAVMDQPVVPAAQPESDRLQSVAAVRLLLEADAAVVQAREEWLAAGEKWAAARKTFALAAESAVRVLPADPVIVRESAAHVRVIRRAGRGVALERLSAVSLSRQG